MLELPRGQARSLEEGAGLGIVNLEAPARLPASPDYSKGGSVSRRGQSTGVAMGQHRATVGEKVFAKISPYLNIFERKHTKEVTPIRKKKYDIVLVGYDKAGFTIIRQFKKKGRVLIVDFNPTTIRELKQEGKDCFFGDISDSEIIEKIIKVSPKLVISTVPNYEDNALLIRKARASRKGIKVFATTNEISQALELYKLGASYVIMPHYIGGKKASILLEEFIDKDFKDIAIEKKLHITELRDFVKRGHL